MVVCVGGAHSEQATEYQPVCVCMCVVQTLRNRDTGRPCESYQISIFLIQDKHASERDTRRAFANTDTQVVGRSRC